MPGAPPGGRSKTTAEVLRPCPLPSCQLPLRSAPNSFLGRKVSLWFKATGRRRNERILLRKWHLHNLFSKVNPLENGLEQNCGAFSSTCGFQGAGLAFLARLHFLSTPAAGHQKQSMCVCAQVGKPPRWLLTASLWKRSFARLNLGLAAERPHPTEKIRVGFLGCADVLPRVSEKHHLSLFYSSVSMKQLIRCGYESPGGGRGRASGGAAE